MSDPVPSDCNPFLLLWDDPPRRPTPEMLYVTLDQAYVLDEETGRCRLVFSAVDARWFGALVRSFGPRSRDVLAKLPIFLLEIELEPGVVFAIARFDYVRLDAAADGAPDPGGLGGAFETLERRWKILTLNEGGPSGELYDNLFGAPVYVSVSAAMEPSSEEMTALDAIDPMDDLPDATVSDISAELGKIGSIDHVAVYDVGQGGANGLVSTDGAVAAYVDFGGGVTSHRTTFPAAVTQFCFCANDVPIILSHWDADHWSSEGRDRRAHGKTWIVPRQKGTLTKRGFHSSAFIAAIIAAGGRLLVWPAGLPSLTAGPVTIWQCLGTSRNGSGLAVTIDAPGGHGDPVLLPADADYHEVPSGARSRVDAVGAPHHGGPVTAAHIPGAPSSSYPRLMYSYGDPNSYKHALPTTRTAHHGQGWHDPVASAGATSLVRNTADLRPHTGHIGFDWGRGLAPGLPTCPGGCPLGIDQV